MPYSQFRNTGRPRAGRHKFSEVPAVEIPRSVFDRSQGLTTAFFAGYLVPIYVDEALPGDTFRMSMSSFLRLATPIFPILDNLTVDYFFFFVPNRLLWDNWQKFMGEQRNPGDSTSFLVPQFSAYTPVASTLSDFMGIPVNNPGMQPITHNSLHHRAYNLIWNEWFRDQNLQNSVVVDTDDGPDNIADYVLLRRGKRHDYFTSAIPFPQKGNPVLLPLGTSAPIITTNPAAVTIASSADPTFTAGGNTGPLKTVGANINEPVVINSGGADASISWGAPGLAGTMSGAQMTAAGMRADLTTATAATINQIREAFQIQRLLERDARGGTRYYELIKAHFGVTDPGNAVLQRPEYLGGGSAPVNVHPVANTNFGAAPATQTPAGSLSAFATSTAAGVGFVKSFTEHGVIIGLACVRADLRYQQGLDRMWFRQDRYDYYWPALAHLGEQEVLSKEIYCDGTAGDNTTFGYQERYAEYRYKPSMITGVMRSTHPTPLDQWHLAQEFSARPLLNATFIQEDPPMDRVLAVPSQPDIFGDFYFNLHCARPMPTYSVPGLVDHF